MSPDPLETLATKVRSLLSLASVARARKRPQAVKDYLIAQGGTLKLLVYSQGVGLGHLQRTRTIAQSLFSKHPNWDTLIIADSASTPFFAPTPGVDYVKLPTIERTGQARWEPATMEMRIDDLISLRSQVILNVFKEFRPDVLLVDHRPVGLLGELKPVLDLAAASRRGPRLVLGLRDILDTPASVETQWSAVGAYEYLPYYDQILVYGDPAVYDAGHEYQLDRHVSSFRYTGYVSSAGGRQAASHSEVPKSPFVLAMGGGGHDAHLMEEAFLRSFPRVASESEVGAVIVAGPNMPDDRRRHLETLAGRVGVTFVSESHGIRSLIGQAEAVVTMAGYNSMVEILASGTRSLVIPRAGPSGEQRIRASIFDELGYATMLSPDEIGDHSIVSDRLNEILAAPSPLRVFRMPRMGGAHSAAEVIAA